MSRALLGAVIALAALDVGLRLARWEARAPELPSVPGFDPTAVTEVRLGRVDEPIVAVRRDGSWSIAAPVDAPADPVELDAIVSRLAGGIHPEVALPADPEGYGLSGGSEIRVDVRGAGGELLSVLVGADAGAGGTFVRVPGEETVYRASIGGRSLYDRPVRTLLDRRVATCDPAAISAVELPGGLRARRSADGWTGDAVDALTVEQLVRRVCSLRGAEVAAPDRVERWVATVRLDDGVQPIALRFGRSADLWYVAREPGDRGGDRAWRVTGDWLERLVAPGTFADRALWTAPEVERIRLVGAGRDGEIVREDGAWQVRRPANVDIDPARAQAVASWLARPRVVRWSDTAPVEAGFPSGEALVISAGGREHRLEIGRAAGETTFVRSGDRPSRIGEIDTQTLRGIWSLFGQ